MSRTLVLDEYSAALAKAPLRNGFQTLKRSRPMAMALEPSSSTVSCRVKGCGGRAPFPSASTSPCCCALTLDTPRSVDRHDVAATPIDDDDALDDDDFDLGPPPAKGPMLFRQHAVDYTLASEAPRPTTRLRFKDPPFALALATSSSSGATIVATGRSGMPRRLLPTTPRLGLRK